MQRRERFAIHLEPLPYIRVLILAVSFNVEDIGRSESDRGRSRIGTLGGSCAGPQGVPTWLVTHIHIWVAGRGWTFGHSTSESPTRYLWSIQGEEVILSGPSVQGSGYVKAEVGMSWPNGLGIGLEIV